MKKINFKKILDRFDFFFIDQWGVIHNGKKKFHGINNFFNILKKNNKKIIIRSIFMQGLIFSNKWPAKIQAFRKKILNKINFFTDKFKRINSLDLFLSYVNYHKKIDGLIIGIDNKSQLFQIFSFLDSKPLNSMQVKEIDKFFNKIPRIVYDVRGWNL